MEFSELNVEYGYCYESAAVVPDGSGAPAPADDIRVYEPSTARVLAAARVADDEDGRRRQRPRAVLTAALSQTLGRRPFAQPGSAGS